MSRFKKIIRISLILLLGSSFAAALGCVGIYLYLSPKLPSIDSLKDVKLQVPLRIYTSDGLLLGEFGEKRRIPVTYEQVPELMRQAFLAAEDDRFYEHPGVDYQGLLRAVAMLVLTGEKRQGGSTITMQVARNFFLSREKTYLRKLNEILLALKIERELTKVEILELYLNKIYLGNRAYGVGAVAQIYYGKKLADLDVAQIAMIAGLPKAPSRYNPVINPSRALTRRNYVLDRMLYLNFIDKNAHSGARTLPVTAKLHANPIELEADYLAEMVRAEMHERFGDEAYTAGYRIYTTVRSRLQKAANGALRVALREYGRRHGYRGPEIKIELAHDISPSEVVQFLKPYSQVGDLHAAMVLEVNEQSLVVMLADGSAVLLDWDAIKWARPYVDDNTQGPEPKLAADVAARGDVVRVAKGGGGQWTLDQIPEVEGALVSIAPRDGAIMALVGGFDFNKSKFNRVTSGERQAGSNFKPFVYSAGLEKGFTAATLINDAPVVFDDPGLESTWRPENYSGRFFGPTRLRRALVKSRNLVSIRLLNQVGVNYAVNYAQNFGFDSAKLPRDLSLALGSASVTPYKLVNGYATFANGGYRVENYFIDRVESLEGQILYQEEPVYACPECSDAAAEIETDGEAVEGPRVPMNNAPQTLDVRNVFLMSTILRDVIQSGTGRRARALGRKDIAGKTGTTNEQRDAWFSGFNHALATTAWVGFDSSKSLGERETGGRAALPMWISFMKEGLKGVPERLPSQPEGLVSARIDPKTGQLARADAKDAIFELFRVENLPKMTVMDSQVPVAETRQINTGTAEQSAEQQLF